MSRPAAKSSDFERGLKRRREVLGEAWVERALKNTNAIRPSADDERR